MDPTYIVIAGIFLKLFAPLIVIGGGGWLILKRTRLGRGLVDRVEDGADDRALLHDVVDHVARLEEVVGELQERLDFAERQLTRGGQPLPALQPSDRQRTPPEPVPVG